MIENTSAFIHRELREGEVFLGHMTLAQFEQLQWQQKRLGRRVSPAVVGEMPDSRVEEMSPVYSAFTSRQEVQDSDLPEEQKAMILNGDPM